MKLSSVFASLFHKKHFRLATEQLKRYEAYLQSPKARFAIPFVYKGRGLFRTIKCMQNPDEIERLFDLVFDLQPRTVIEVGTAQGGALYLWCQAAADDATVISIDLPGGEFGGGYHKHREPFYHHFAREKQQLHLLRANSQIPETVKKTQNLLNGNQVDFLFIDGDHTYEGVKTDFSLYSPLVRKGGVIAFHDILPRHDIPEIEVYRFWEEIKKTYPYEEIIGKEGSGRKIGSGVIWIK
ncbi:MAG: hypothetical protein Tsb0021_09230 [Chlamydiales bacterium]